MYAIPDGQYTINSTAKNITLSPIYTGITAGQISHIVDITSGEVLYDANASRSRYTKITVSGVVVTYEYGQNVKNTDKLRIMVDNSIPGVNGGTAANLRDSIQFRNDSSSNLTTSNPIPKAGEPLYNTTDGWLKIGDGSTPYNLLPTITTGATYSEVVGIKWDTSSSSPTLKWIDIDGNERTDLNTAYFNQHMIWGNMKRCTIDPATNIPAYGLNARGDGLDQSGATGNVMVRIPPVYVKFAQDGVYNMWWVSPIPRAGFELFPAWLMRGGTQAELFISAFEASGFLDGSTFKLRSITGVQPVTGEVSYPNLPNSGRLYIGDIETYANNIGTGYGSINIWTIAIARLLFYIEYKSFDSQTVLGKGIVDLASGTGFAGKNTGVDSVNTNIGTNGTGTGTGTNGQTPIVYRGIENLWGNTWTWIIGINFYDTVHRILKADGTGTVAAVLTAGNYTESVSVPPNTGTAANGYISGVFADSVLKYLILGSATAGSSSTYMCDYYYLRAASATPTCLLFGGYWANGLNAGVGYLYSADGAAYSFRSRGARLEFLKR